MKTTHLKGHCIERRTCTPFSKTESLTEDKDGLQPVNQDLIAYESPNQKLILKAKGWQKPFKHTSIPFEEFRQKSSFYGLYEAILKSSLSKVSAYVATSRLISAINFHDRGHADSIMELNPSMEKPKIGDLYYFDFGTQYHHETSYLHPGIVLNTLSGKLEVVPVTTSPSIYHRAIRFHVKELVALPKTEGLLPENSAVLLDDVRWINSARIVRLIGHIEPTSALFQNIIRSRKALEPDCTQNVEGTAWEIKPVPIMRRTEYEDVS